MTWRYLGGSMAAVRIPDNVLRQSHVARYGGGSFELVVGYDEPGCPRAYYLTYEERRPEEPSIPRKRGTAVHEALAIMEDEAVSVDEALSRAWPPELGPDLYMESINMILEWLAGPDDGSHTMASEIELTLPLYVDEDFGPIHIGGRLDRLAMEMEDPRTLIVDDFKTDAAPPSYRDLDEWFQGYFYAALVRDNAGTWLGDDVRPRIRVRYVALRHYTIERPKPYTDEELDLFLAWAESLARKILRDEEHEPVLNPGCHHCDFRMDCPAWLALPGEGVTLLERIRNTTLEDQMPLRPLANATRLKLEHFKNGIDDLAKHRLKVGESVEAGGVRVSREVREQDRIEDLHGAHELMGEEFYEAANLSKKALMEYARVNPDKIARVNQLLNKQVVGDGLKWEDL